MRRYPTWSIVTAAFLSLNACAPLPSSPSIISDQTIVDERLGIGAELTYTTATKLGTVLARAGLVDPAKFKALDNDAYKALLEVREAYKTGNAASYAEAVSRLQTSIQRINQFVEGNREP